jgi:hypothetical protein
MDSQFFTDLFQSLTIAVLVIDYMIRTFKK